MLEARDTITLSYTQQALLCEEYILKDESKTGRIATRGEYRLSINWETDR